MAVGNAEVVMGTKDVAGHHRAVLPAVLLGIALVHDVNHALGIAVPKVGVMRGTIVDLEKIKGN